MDSALQTRRDNSNVRYFFIYNIFVQFVGLVFQQTIATMGTNCAPVIMHLFSLMKKTSFKNSQDYKSLKTSFCYIDDVLSRFRD